MSNRAVKIVRNTLLVLLLLIMMAVAGLTARLMTGPIQMMWAVPWLESALDAQGGMAAALAVDDLSLRWNQEARRVEFTAEKVRLKEQDQTLSAVERVGVTLSTSGLLQGRLSIKDITLVAPHLKVNLQRTEDKTGAAPLAIFSGGGNNPIARLNSVMIQRGVIELQTDAGEARHVLSGVQIDWQRKSGETTAVMNGTLQLAEDPAPRPIHITLHEKDELIDLGVRVKEVSPDNIQGIMEALSPGLISPSMSLQRLQMPVTLDMNIALTAAGALRNVSGTVTTDTGHVIAPELFDIAIPVQHLTVTGNYDAATGAWEISDLKAALLDEDAPIPITAAASSHPQDGSLKFKLTLGNVNASALKRWWPPSAAPGGYVWVKQFIHEGNVANTDFAMALKKDAQGEWDIEDVNGKWEVQGIGVTFLPAFGPVTDINGVATMNADEINFDINYGRLHGLEMQNAKMKIDGLRADMQNMYLDLPVVGQLPNALELIDTAPYGYATKYGLNYRTAHGGIGLYLHFEFPLLAALPMQDVKYEVSANLRDISMQNILMGKDIAGGEGTFELTPQEMKVDGKAALAGVPMTFDWQDYVTPKDDMTRNVNFKAEMLDDDLAKFGLPTQGYIKGKSHVEGSYETRNGANTLRVKLDLAPATVNIRELNYSKAAGAPMTVNASIGMGTNTNNLALTAAAEKFALDGTGILNADMKPTDLNFGIFRVGERTNASLRLTTNGTAQRWMIRGQSFDASGILADDPNAAAQPQQPKAKTPRWVGAELGTLYLMNNTMMQNVKLEMNDTGVRINKLLLNGTLNGKTPVNVVWDQRGGENYLNAETNDAGAVLSAFGVTDTMRGGRLTLRGTGNPKDPNFWAAGKVVIRDFRIVNAPLLAKLLTLTTPGGLLDALSGEGISFSRFESGVEYNDYTLRLREGKVSGASLGLSFEGDINHGADPDTVSIKGTIIPLFASVNNILSKLPLVGNILGESGLLAFNFKASGAVTDPEVSVNPLSALTPGFLRDLLFDNSAVPDQKN